MALLGKILLVVNLLAAAGLVYVAAQDWGKRQAVSDVALRHTLYLIGIPVDPSPGTGSDSSVPLAVPVGPGIQTEYVSKKLYDAHFAAAKGGEYAGPGSPLSQVDEVKAVFDKIMRDKVDGAGGDAAALRYLCGTTTPQGLFSRDGLLYVLAESFEERAAVRALAESKDVPAAKTAAVDRLKRKFDAATGKPNPRGFDDEQKKLDEAKAKVDAAPNDEAARAAFTDLLALGAPPFAKDDADRRRRIALLLMLVDVSPDNQKRAMTICGLPVYLAALGEHAARVEEATRRTERGWEVDQSTFEDEYELLKRLALEKDQQVQQQQRAVKQVQSLLAADNEAVSRQEGQLKGLNDQLAALQQEVTRLLAEQKKIEDSLFETQKQAGQVRRSTFDKEARLKQAELSRGK